MVGAYYYWKKYSNASIPSEPPRFRLGIPFISLSLLIILYFVPITLGSSSIRIDTVDLAPLYQPTLPPNAVREPLARMNFHNDSNHVISYQVVGNVAFLGSLPEGWTDKQEKLEDEFWDRTATGLKYADPPQDAPSHRPLLMPIFGTPLTEEQAKNIAEANATVYLMTIFVYHDWSGTHETDYCGYVLGNINSIQVCHKHNAP
jgi:hypothetical protein